MLCKKNLYKLAEMAIENGAEINISTKKMIELFRKNPFEMLSPFKKLVGDLTGAYSRKINRQHRLVYNNDVKLVLEEIVKAHLDY